MPYAPAPELVKILRPAYSPNPCPASERTCGCGNARWEPKKGHVPRGFVGAFGSLDDVRVVILLAEPGDPGDGKRLPAERYNEGADLVEQTCEYTFQCLSESHSAFHKNLRFVLDCLFPGERLDDQLTKAWITETYLCSASVPAGSVPRPAENECAGKFLAPQLRRLEGLPVIALGGKAFKRAKTHVPRDRLRKAYSVGPPGCNHAPARPSWEAAAKWARAIMDQR